MRISLIQTESNGTKQENENKIFIQLFEAIKDKPDIICLTELFLSWGKDFSGGIVKADEIKKYQSFALNNNVNIVLGSVALETDNPKMITNTSFVIDRNGNIVGRYDKIHMYKVNKPDFKFDEKDDTIPGKELGVFELDGIKIGVGICFDLRFPEYFRKLIKNGVKVIFLPSHFNKKTGNIAWDVLTRARAIENQVYFCAANQTGENLCGNTRVISYNGEIIKSLNKEEGILTVNLDLEEQDRFRNSVPFLEQMVINKE